MAAEVKKGFLHGETSAERPCKTIKDRVVIEDLHATLLHTLGIPPTLAYKVEKRPFYVTRDGEGKVIRNCSDDPPRRGHNSLSQRIARGIPCSIIAL